MFKKIALGGLVALSAITLVACGKSPDVTANAKGNESSKDTIKIGVNMELSGAVAAYGKAELNGIELAVDEINAAGGVDGRKIELITKDNKSETAEASTTATNLAVLNHVDAIIGPATSGATAASSLVSQKTGVLLLSPSGTQDNLTINTDGTTKKYVFRTTFKDSYQGQVLAQYVTDNMKAKKVVLYYDNSSDYAQGIAAEFKRQYKGDIVAESTFIAGDKDYKAALTRFKDLDYDAIVMPGYYTETGIITKQAREMGITQPILGPDGFSDATFVQLAGTKNATDVYYVSGYSTKVNLSNKATAFIANFKKRYKEEPNMFAALAYDSVYMVAEAAKGSKNSTEIADNLAKLKDFEGVTGTMTIDDQHNPIKPALIVKMENGAEASATPVEVTQK
ncbi:ABC transporter substrate-binding protein [Streptococcus sp. DD13]|uniref:ABC transporter substrate-binding protein n=1 Tax=Streptococcus sp. DD13 TaxID=1777881 RepID=UPI000794E9E9|nr:ABC transporter substrate-binding protein [Streptococcus sp. DD13]KXT78481.1 Branched-chain amino acid ABC transporter, amino acid-binding protein [Streptococcus sp. DD13]